ncbi:UrcA family protein [Sphingosinicella sp. LY1275]|uniref:UrcA family protein n=1 Tax=Sphingosinicella sp. LY1275 TaxID=3095379 RepID=UPI002ADEBDE9|nr:UrcA family protein [Sphingosinicella sp. LY1275]MEA1014075.1 UrcA family protein [Sphingosinicella sp. LY1275]
MNQYKIGAAALAAAIATLGVPAMLQAAERTAVVEGIVDRPTAVVSYRDLNLANADGVDRLQARVRRAASQICIKPGIKHLTLIVAENNCRDDAVAGAQEQIEMAVANFGNTQLAALSQISVTAR